MGERQQTGSNDSEQGDDFLDALGGDFIDDELGGFDEGDETDKSGSKQGLAEKRRRAEQRLEALRLREELGDYDFDFDDY